MPAGGPGGFNIGKDTVLDITTSSGVLRLSNITGFQAKQEVHQLDHKPLDGRILFAHLPAGWSGTFDLERASSVLDDYIAQQESNYFGGLTSDTITITETNSEVNGAVTQYRYTGVALYFEDAGQRTQDQVVKQKVSFKAARRVKIA